MIHNKDIAKHTSWVYEIHIHSNGMGGEYWGLGSIQWLSGGFRGFRNHFTYHHKISPKKTCRLQCFFPELIESSSHRFLTLLFPLTRWCSFGSSWAADISITRVIYIHVPIFNMIYNYFCNCNFLEIQVFAVIQFLYLVRWLAYILASYGIMLIIR